MEAGFVCGDAVFFVDTVFLSDGKVVAMSYWKISPDIIEDQEKLTRLFEMSYEINLKPKEAKMKKKV